MNDTKFFFIGVSLSSSSTTETGIAVLDSDLNINLLDKIFSMKDLEYFLDTFQSKKNSVICVSLPKDNAILNAKWKVNGKASQLLEKQELLNTDGWANKLSKRDVEYFLSLKQKNIDIYRFDINYLRSSLCLNSTSKSRTPSDCKFLQDMLRVHFNLDQLPLNMIPAAQLEAILGAYAAHKIASGKSGIDYISQFSFHGIPVAGLLPNLN